MELVNKIKIALQPEVIKLTDESHKHADHFQSDYKVGTHLKLLVVSEHFCGLNKLARHKLIYQIATDYFNRELHALQIAAYTPEEYEGLKSKGTN